MSTIQELRAKAQADGQELVKQFQELDVQKNEIIAKQRQLEKQVDALNGEINAYNKIEPPVQDAPNEAPETDD